MRVIELTHIIEDTELEQKMAELEERCQKLQDNNVTLECLLQTAITVMPMKTYMTALVMWTDDKVHELEQQEKRKNMWRKLFPKKNS